MLFSRKNHSRFSFCSPPPLQLISKCFLLYYNNFLLSPLLFSLSDIYIFLCWLLRHKKLQLCLAGNCMLHLSEYGLSLCRVLFVFYYMRFYCRLHSFFFSLLKEWSLQCFNILAWEAVLSLFRRVCCGKGGYAFMLSACIHFLSPSLTTFIFASVMLNGRVEIPISLMSYKFCKTCYLGR